MCLSRLKLWNTKTSLSREFSSALLTFYLVCLSFLMFYALSFEKPQQASILTASATILVLIGLFVVITIVLGTVLRMISEDRLFAALSGGVFVVSAIVLLVTGPSVGWVFYSVVFNLILLVMIAALLFYSSRLSSPGLANLGLGLFVLLVVTRYFDLLWDLLVGSALFLITGALAMGGGYLLLRSQKKLVEHIRSNRSEETQQ